MVSFKIASVSLCIAASFPMPMYFTRFPWKKQEENTVGALSQYNVGAEAALCQAKPDPAEVGCKTD